MIAGAIFGPTNTEVEPLMSFIPLIFVCASTLAQRP